MSESAAEVWIHLYCGCFAIDVDHFADESDFSGFVRVRFLSHDRLLSCERLFKFKPSSRLSSKLRDGMTVPLAS